MRLGDSTFLAVEQRVRGEGLATNVRSMEPLHAISESVTGDGTVMGNDQLFRGDVWATGVASTDKEDTPNLRQITKRSRGFWCDALFDIP